MTGSHSMSMIYSVIMGRGLWQWNSYATPIGSPWEIAYPPLPNPGPYIKEILPTVIKIKWAKNYVLELSVGFIKLDSGPIVPFAGSS